MQQEIACFETGGWEGLGTMTQAGFLKNKLSGKSETYAGWRMTFLLVVMIYTKAVNPE